MERHAAVILAGGHATRMGGVPKAGLRVGGHTLIDRVLRALPDAQPRVAVGDVVHPGVIVTAEKPPRSGPAYATIAGLRHIPASVPFVAVLAVDLPFLTTDVINALVDAADHAVDGAILIDPRGRQQWLCGVWRHESLRRAGSQIAPGASMRDLLGGLTTTALSWWDSDVPPWFDCDTDEDVRRAKEWVR